ncbi:MAG: hypothetical protein ISS70_15420 [Phycisphaerae bacterium]|nr:hypothetical protein [Phycisphaerae bacterium]
MDRIRTIRNVSFTVCALLLAGVIYAQQEEQGAPTIHPGRKDKTRSELLNELTLRDAVVVLETAREAHDRFKSEYLDAERLIKQNIIAQKDLDDAWSEYNQAQQALKQAEILLERTKLGFLDNATHITIMEAKKYNDPNGRRMLDLVLKNTSNLALAESALGLTASKSQLQSEWQSPEQIQALLNIENIIVSIVGNSSSIGKPYERIIPVLPYGNEERLQFVLLTDVEEAGIKLKYLTEERLESIFLEKESLQKIPRIVASQFALEGSLGSGVGYALDLEMLVTSVRNFSVAVTNVPPQIPCTFVEGGSRITSVHFSEDVSKHNVMLSAAIPEKLDAGMIDKRIDFQAWITTTAQLDQINKLRRKYEPELIPVQDLDAIEAARVDLTLIPRGTGRLEILVNNVYVEIKPDQEVVDFRADLRNDGTVTLFNVTPEITSQPLDWTAHVDPNLIEKLEPDEKRRVTIHLTPPAQEGVGEYQAELEARGQSGDQVIEAAYKRLTVKINAKTNMMATLGLAAGLFVLITGIVFMGVRLSRR